MKSLIYIVVLLIITGCSFSSSTVDHGLDEVASLIQRDPMAAMNKLNKYDVAELQDSATLARWALLYSEALVANKITAPTDTIINIALDYYKRHHCTEEYTHATRLKALLKGPGESNALAEALYIQKEKEFMLYKERAVRKQSVLIGFIILLVALEIIIWQRYRLKKRHAQIKSLMVKASGLMSSLSNNELLCSDLQEKLKTMLHSRFDVIDQLCETYFESQGTKTERKAIVEKVKSQIAELQSDSGLFAEMERSVNDGNNGLLNHLREELPTLKPDEYRLMVYLACNLSSRSIAALTDENIDVVYKRKSRLKAKISKLRTPHADNFMSVF